MDAEEEEGTHWEIRTDIYTLPCVEQIVSGKLLRSTRELSSALCEDLEGWDERGSWQGGSRVRGCMYTESLFMMLYGRNQYNTVKQLS